MPVEYVKQIVIKRASWDKQRKSTNNPRFSRLLRAKTKALLVSTTTARPQFILVCHRIPQQQQLSLLLQLQQLLLKGWLDGWMDAWLMTGLLNGCCGMQSDVCSSLNMLFLATWRPGFKIYQMWIEQDSREICVTVLSQLQQKKTVYLSFREFIMVLGLLQYSKAQYRRLARRFQQQGLLSGASLLP